MEKEVIKEKLEFYKSALSDLENTNIEEEVNKRLQPHIEEIRNTVISEIDADKIKCKHYIEILEQLDYDMNKVETPIEPEAQINTVEVQ